MGKHPLSSDQVGVSHRMPPLPSPISTNSGRVSRLLKEASKMATSKGFALVLHAISHIFCLWMIFLIFCEGSRRIVEKFKNILDLFCKATSMIINLDKSTLSMWDIPEHEKGYFSQLFPYQVIDMDQGLKYLGFHLKPNLYKKGDWQWLVAKVEKKINHWCNQWLSRGGRLVLVKAVLGSHTNILDFIGLGFERCIGEN
jgi:hypothetical protein